MRHFLFRQHFAVGEEALDTLSNFTHISPAGKGGEPIRIDLGEILKSHPLNPRKRDRAAPEVEEIDERLLLRLGGTNANPLQ